MYPEQEPRIDTSHHSSLGGLLKSMRRAATEGLTRDQLKDMRSFMEYEKCDVEATAVELPDPTKQLIIAGNHFSRRPYLTSKEAIVAASAISIAAADARIHPDPPAWLQKRLDVGIIDLLTGRFRESQNNFDSVYGNISVQLNGKQKIINTEEIVKKTQDIIRQNRPFGVFPEQEPSHTLKRFNKGFLSFLRAVSSLAEIERANETILIVPAGLYFEGRLAKVRFGKSIEMTRDFDADAIAHQTMKGIAEGLPRHLRGPYS